MNSFDMNKIAAAFLLAGLTVMVSMQVGKLLVHTPTVATAATPTESDSNTNNNTPNTASSEIEPVSQLLAKADIAAGEAVAKRCTSCHTFTKGGANKIGPNLWNIVNNKVGHMDGFAYSQALLGLNKNWGYEELNQFLFSPKGFAGNTKMSFAGIKKLQERVNLIAWLRLQSDNPPPLPAP